MAQDSGNTHPARRVKLASLRELRREAAALYRAARGGEVAASDASKLASILALIARMIEGDDHERRLEALENQQKGTRPCP